MSIEVAQQTSSSEIKSFNRIDFIKKFNMIVRALEKTKLRFNIHEFVNEKDD